MKNWHMNILMCQFFYHLFVISVVTVCALFFLSLVIIVLISQLIDIECSSKLFTHIVWIIVSVAVAVLVWISVFVVWQD